jgi:signal transduction histidine kinase
MRFLRRDAVVDLALTTAIGVELMVTISVSQEPGARPAGAGAYALGLAMALPILAWRRRPLAALLVSSAVLFAYYAIGYPGFSPVFALSLQMYFAALAGRARWALGIALFYLATGFFVTGVREHDGVFRALGNFLPHLALLSVIILLGAHVRSRRELAAETRERLRQAEESREREAARRVAEERLRIAREVHDTVAHSMATIIVQAGSALHRLGERADPSRDALVAIRRTGKEALAEIRSTLGMLRDGAGPGQGPGHDLDGMPALLDAVRAAGLTVDVVTEGARRELGPGAGHAAYRILQESLTNVLRHAGSGATARVRLAYREDGLDIEVTDDGTGPGGGAGGGNGLTGMRERASAAGGTFAAGPAPGGGFRVTARLPAAGPAPE